MSEKLTWIPLYIDRLLSSPAWQQMQDFQRGWYWQMLMQSVRSERPGYLRLDSSLWTTAGAKRKDFFDSHKSIVLACFKVCEMEGQRWIYNERMVQTLEEQVLKYRKKSTDIPISTRRDSDSISPSCSLEVAFEVPPGMKARNERERLANVAEAKKRGF